MYLWSVSDCLRKHEALNQCWLNVVPVAKTSCQHYEKQLYLLRTDHDTVAHYITRQFSFQRNSILLRRYNALICGVITPYFKALLRLIRALLRLKLKRYYALFRESILMYVMLYALCVMRYATKMAIYFNFQEWIHIYLFIRLYIHKYIQ